MHDKFVYALEIITIYSSSFKFWFVLYAEMDKNQCSLTCSPLQFSRCVNIIFFARICGHVSDICYLSRRNSFKLRKLDTMLNRPFSKDYSMADKMTTKGMAASALHCERMRGE